ncbi:MAG: NAD(P)H-hydrate dehydratase [Gammaproteobacteria bacterium]|nr:NAD(P)H-hydrate dehydratase [Gammaproteobacteria bacterium]
MTSLRGRRADAACLPRRPFGRPEVYAPTGREAAAFDRWAIDEAGVPAAVLMENAGRAAALVADRIWPDGPVVVLAGAGNNGGDGVVLARTLLAHGREVRILHLGRETAPDPLLHGWPVPAGPVPSDAEALRSVLVKAGVVVDALLGTGIRGSPREPVARVIQAVNGSRTPVVSLDVPSGVDADWGEVPGEAVRADVTIAFGAPKLGTLLFPGRGRAGRIVAVEIGFPPPGARATPARVITPGWAGRHRPRRRPVTHKKAEGQLLIVAGSPGVAGAAVLAGRGALRAGVGYLRIASHPENREILQAALPEALYVNALDGEALGEAAEASDALAAGPGIGIDGDAGRRLDALLALPGPRGLLLDADALTLLGAGGLPAFARASSPARRLLTPHPGEMARLGAPKGEIRARPVGVARRAAESYRSAVLLKGQPSLLASATEECIWVGTGGSSELARAGTGDVLAGVAGAFLARGADAAAAGALALHYTGRAAALARRGEALLPTDIADSMARALGEIPPRRPDLGFPFVLFDLDRPH